MFNSAEVQKEWHKKRPQIVHRLNWTIIILSAPWHCWNSCKINGTYYVSPAPTNRLNDQLKTNCRTTPKNASSCAVFQNIVSWTCDDWWKTNCTLMSFCAYYMCSCREFFFSAQYGLVPSFTNNFFFKFQPIRMPVSRKTRFVLLNDDSVCLRTRVDVLRERTQM